MLRFLYVLAVVILVAIAVAATIPAVALRALIPEALRGSIGIAEASGRLDQGRAVLLVNGVRVPLAWTIAPLPLLQGRLEATIHPYERADGPPRGRIGWGVSRLALDEVTLQLPAGVVLPPSLAAAGALVGGELRIDARHVEQKGNVVDGSARVAWKGARLLAAKGAPVIDLGDVDLALNANGNRLEGTISNRGGALALAGSFAAGPGSAPRASVLATPRSADDRSLLPALSALGRPEGGGWRLEWPAGAR